MQDGRSEWTNGRGHEMAILAPQLPLQLEVPVFFVQLETAGQLTAVAAAANVKVPVGARVRLGVSLNRNAST